MSAIASVSTSVAHPTANTGKDPKLLAVAQQLEASFLAEMLKSAGFGEARQSFGGGAGEDHFSSFLVREYADATVEAGGIGLAEVIYHSLVSAEDAGK